MIFVEYPRREIKPSKYIQEVLDQHPVCHECNGYLEEGDFLDNLFPMFDEYNICRKCLEEK